jgi:hypothetical protein
MLGITSYFGVLAKLNFALPLPYRVFLPAVIFLTKCYITSDKVAIQKPLDRTVCFAVRAYFPVAVTLLFLFSDIRKANIKAGSPAPTGRVVGG